MKIAMIGAKGVPATVGGVERHVQELSTRLAAGGFDVSVYGRPWYTGYASWSVRNHDGIRSVMVPSIRTKHLDAISHTLLATVHAMREDHDVYHFHGVGPALVAFLPRIFRPRSRTIVTFHCVDRKHEKWGVLARLALAVGEWMACRIPQETITVGETLHAYCRDRYGRDTTCISNGVAVQRDVAPAIAATRLADFGLTSRRYLLVVTRLVPHKSVQTTIAAFRQLRMERPEFRDLELAIVGAPAFTDTYRDELVVAAGGDARIHFLGHQHGVALDALYQNCLAFVHASRSEGLPIVVLEAAAAGAVPIVSDIPEHEEVIRRIGGFTFRTGDVHDLVMTLDIVLRSSALVAMGAGIRDAVLGAYDWESRSVEVAACYRGYGPAPAFAS